MCTIKTGPSHDAAVLNINDHKMADVPGSSHSICFIFMDGLYVKLITNF